LNLSLESSIAREDRLKKELASTVQVTPMIIPTLNEAAKVKWLKYVAKVA
jgi:hypothetical protein